MSLPAKLKRLLKSDPATVELGAYIETIEAEGYDDTEIKADITALETAIGDSSSGLTKDVNDNADSITALETAIGDESTEGTILARIKALEDAS